MTLKKAKEYACPMHCEGDKVYYKPGDCPVCNMHLTPVDKNDKHSEHQHIAVQSEHAHKAEKKKDKHLDKTGNIQKSGTIYTCPMHPEVEQDHPGSCPKCGMTLVPEKSGEDSHEEDAYLNMLKKFRIALKSCTLMITKPNVFRTINTIK